MNVRILRGDCRDVLKTLSDESVHCIVTSPPYWGLRDYGVDGQLGLEATPSEYVERMVGVFSEARRVLRSDGTLWLNLGDSYAAEAGGGQGEHRSEVTRAIREADASHGRESQCMTLLVSTRSGLGLLVPSVGGVGGTP